MTAVDQAVLGGIHPVRSSASAPHVQPDEQNTAQREALQPTRILVVEDEAWIAIELQHALTAGGYEVVGLAADAQTAVDLTGERGPTLVLMDIHLAGRGDGIEAASLIR